MSRLGGWALAAILGLAAAGAGAESPPPFPEFTFKKVGVPRKSTNKRITVQIAPPQIAAKPAPAAPSAPKKAPDGFSWFWSAVPDSMNHPAHDRFEKALGVISAPPAGQAAPAYRLQRLQDIASARGTDILISTVGTRVSPALALAVIAVESSGRKDAVSGAGAQGLMQLMPATAARFGVEDPLHPLQNIRGGVAYLDWLMGEFESDPVMVLAAYNAGENAVRKHGGVPPFPETRGYVPKVLAAFQVARGLCATPPQLVSDGCVFAVNAD